MRPAGNSNRGSPSCATSRTPATPAVLGDRGARGRVTGSATRSPLPVQLRLSTQCATLPVEAAIDFTVAEALTNVATHAQVTTATVTIENRRAATMVGP